MGERKNPFANEELGEFYFWEPSERLPDDQQGPFVKKREDKLEPKFMKELTKFCEEKLDKMFESWLLVGKSTDEKKFTELEGGELAKGLVLYNPGDDVRGDEQEERTSVAMLMLGATESVCEDETTVESFLEALWRTSKHHHDHKHGRDEDKKKHNKEYLTDTEELKVEVLKNLMGICLDMFDTYQGKYRFAMSAIGSVIPALLLDKGNENVRKRVREDMTNSIKNGKIAEGNRLTKIIDNATSMADDVLDMVDNGTSVPEATDIFRDHFKFNI